MEELVEGLVAPGFEAVGDAFVANFAAHGDVGAACCVYLDGRPVVDVWSGLADAATGRRWRADTPVVVFSATKGVTAIVVHRLVERGVLDLDTTVADVWPEFAAAGKGGITLRAVLSHRAGVPAIDAAVTLDDVVGWDGVVRAIAAQTPEWEPGTQHGYHARTFGWILGEVVRRVTGMSYGRHLAEEITEPLGLDLWVGLPEDVEPRLATLIKPEAPRDRAALARMAALAAPGTLFSRVMSGPSNLFAYDERWNRRPLHAAEMPSSNGVTTASSLARLYAATIGDVDGVRLLQPETIERAIEVHSDGLDTVLEQPTRFGLGFGRPPFLDPAAATTAFGHTGAGGSLAFADPARGMAFAYVLNRMRFDAPEEPDLRATNLVRAVSSCC